MGVEPVKRRALPVMYGLVALVCTALLLPSALRPPPEQTSESVGFDPDAPPDESPEAIIQSLQQARSRTAGATGEAPAEDAAAPATTATTLPRRPSRGQCYGDPPRQVESVYAGPCVEAWEGDNGGATYKNVTGDQVVIAIWHSLGTPQEGFVATEPPPNEGEAHRTMRVLQQYFNTNFETYGRQVRLYALPGGESAEDQQRNAVIADEEAGAFVATYIALDFCEEMARRGLLTFCDPGPSDFMEGHAPFVYSWPIDRGRAERLGAELLCKQLDGRTAEHAGAGLSTQPRRFGLLTESSAKTRLDPATQVAAFEAACGGAFEVSTTIAETMDASAMSSAIAQMRAEGVTTIVPNVSFVNFLTAQTVADSIGYQPEWLLFTPYGMDINVIGSLMPQNQMQRTFGLSGLEIPRPESATDCWRAYKSIDPDNNPGGASCGAFFQPILQIMNGIQMAGPDLTPETFESGLFAIGNRPRLEPYAVGGGFGPGNRSFVNDVGLIWWDPSATRPEDGSPGAYRWLEGGQRFEAGQIPETPLPWFEDGIVASSEVEE